MTAQLVAKVLSEKGAITGADFVAAIVEDDFPDSIFGSVSWDQGNNMVGTTFVREVVRHADGKLYNDPIADYPDQSQYLGKDPQSVIDQDRDNAYSNTNQGL
jgi:branched-chain amino acid transport system substrate-binding protein